MECGVAGTGGGCCNSGSSDHGPDKMFFADRVSSIEAFTDLAESKQAFSISGNQVNRW